MPVEMEDQGQVANEQVRNGVDQTDDGATDSDLAFLRNVLENTTLNSLVKAQDASDMNDVYEPVGGDNVTLMHELVDEITPQIEDDERIGELSELLQTEHMNALLTAHDDIANKNYESNAVTEYTQLPSPPPPSFMGTATDAIRMVGIRKHSDEPLGFTVTINQKHELIVARIFTDGDVYKQGLLHEGDIIREVNGQEVTTPESLQDAMRRATGSVTLKVIPSFRDFKSSTQIFMKAHFSYDPYRDNLIPCREAGLGFKDGEVLEILNTDDQNWWQAKKVGEDGRAGLIPSQALEERRKAFVKPDFDYTHKSYLCGLGLRTKKKKQMYKISGAGDYDKTDIMVYEEVTRMPPFQRKTLVLIGASGVGRRTLKNMFIREDPERFGTTIPYTTRSMREGEENGKGYNFVSRETMEAETRENQFLEHGVFDRNLYGTKLDSIRQVIRSGRMCVLDINPQSLKLLKTPEFMPYIVFVAAPNIDTLRVMHDQAKELDKSTKTLTDRDFGVTVEESSRVERAYRQLFDFAVVNDNMDETFEEIATAVDKLSNENQWVPVSWVY